MANRDEPQGFRPCGVPLRVNPYTAGGTIYPGDPVKLKSDGTIEVADTTAALCGIAASYAIVGETVLVFDHPDQQFIGQSDSADIDAATDLNINYAVVLGTASTAYRLSRAEIDGDSGVSNSNYPLKALRLEPKAGNALGANADIVVKINNHQLAGGTGTTGV